MTRTTVILVNFNNAGDTAKCIKSLLHSQVKPRLVIVDNASVEPGLEEALVSYPSAKVIYSHTNIGFGRGNNVGIVWALSNTECEFVFILNNDALVKPETISVLENALDTYPEVGIVCPRIVMMEDPNTLWYGGGEINWCKGSAQIPGYRGSADSKQALAARNVSFASGCAMLIRRTVLRRVGGFDPRFFMYEEDLELCLRVIAAGSRVRYVPEAIVMHKGQGSQRKDGQEFLPIQHPRNPRLPFFMYHVTKNKLLLMTTHAKGWRAVQFWSIFPIFWTIKCLQFFLYDRWDAVTAVIQGIKDFYHNRNKPFTCELTTKVELNKNDYRK